MVEKEEADTRVIEKEEAEGADTPVAEGSDSPVLEMEGAVGAVATGADTRTPVVGADTSIPAHSGGRRARSQSATRQCGMPVAGCRTPPYEHGGQWKR